MRALCLFASLAVTSVLAADSQPVRTEADIAWLSSGDFCEPETVLPLPDGTLLVSNVCGFAAMGNGYLSLLDRDGNAINWRIVDGLDSPLGMAISRDQLYVVDANRVRVFAVSGFASLDVIELPTKVANDIAVAEDGTLYVTDSATHKVLRRTADGTTSWVAADFRFGNANGIQLFGNGLYVGGERLWRVDLDDESIDTIGPEWLADIDGIEFEGDGTLQLTPVGGPLVRYRNDHDISVYAGDGVSSANHGFSRQHNLALIPTGFDNTVIAIRVKPLD